MVRSIEGTVTQSKATYGIWRKRNFSTLWVRIFVQSFKTEVWK